MSKNKEAGDKVSYNKQNKEDLIKSMAGFFQNGYWKTF